MKTGTLTIYQESLRDLQLALATNIMETFNNGLTKRRSKKRQQIERAIYRLKRMHGVKN